MNPRHILRPALAGALLLFGGGGATAQSGEAVNATRAIERGQWELRNAGGGTRRLCLTNPAVLIQIQHGSARCEHFVEENGNRTATIRYTCNGRGIGRTTLTVESGRLFSLDTQGVVDGSPFSEQYEGRLLGRC